MRIIYSFSCLYRMWQRWHPHFLISMTKFMDREQWLLRWMHPWNCSPWKESLFWCWYSCSPRSNETAGPWCASQSNLLNHAVAHSWLTFLFSSNWKKVSTWSPPDRNSACVKSTQKNLQDYSEPHRLDVYLLISWSTFHHSLIHISLSDKLNVMLSVHLCAQYRSPSADTTGIWWP